MQHDLFLRRGEILLNNIYMREISIILLGQKLGLHWCYVLKLVVRFWHIQVHFLIWKIYAYFHLTQLQMEIDFTFDGVYIIVFLICLERLYTIKLKLLIFEKHFWLKLSKKISNSFVILLLIFVERFNIFVFL